MNGTTPMPRNDRYAYWRSTSALGNALNGWMHVFLYALASGRQLVAGDGLAVELLCGTHGAFLCGIPYRSRSWLKQQSSRGVDAGWTDSDHAVHTADLMWFKSVWKAKFNLCFNFGFVGVWVRCYSPYWVECIPRRSWPRLGLSEDRGGSGRRDAPGPDAVDATLHTQVLPRRPLRQLQYWIRHGGWGSSDVPPKKREELPLDVVSHRLRVVHQSSAGLLHLVGGARDDRDAWERF